MTITATIRRLAKRTTGVRSDEVPSCTTQQACVALNKLVAKGELHKAVLGHRHVRYFADGGMRDAYMLHIQQVRREHERMGIQQRELGRHAPWPDDAPAHYPTDEHGVPTWKFTECPPFVPRFAAIELPIYGGNQRGRVMA